MPTWFTLRLPALALLVLAGTLGTAEDASPRPIAQTPAQTLADAPVPARTSRRKPRIVHLPSPSEESSAQRDRRLARECRGLPNAGVCLGYTAASARRASGASTRR